MVRKVIIIAIIGAQKKRQEQEPEPCPWKAPSGAADV